MTCRRCTWCIVECCVGRITVIITTALSLPAANADIFFDATLRRLTGPPAHRPLPTLHAQRTVLALLKWMHQPQDDTISLHVRTDSQGRC